MQPRQLLILTALVAALGAFIFLYEKDLPSTDERAAQAKKVLHLDQANVESITLVWDDHQVHLERAPLASDSEAPKVEASELQASSQWHITSPLEARADANAIDNLLQTLLGLESERDLEGFDPEEVGLAEPRARATIKTVDGSATLEIGAEIPASGDMIVGVAGQKTAYQVPSTLFEELTVPPGDWRDKKLFFGSRGEIDRIALEGEQRVELIRQGEDFWLETPISDQADEDKVNGLLSSLTGLTVNAFIDDSLMSPDAMGLEPANGEIEVTLAGSETPFRFELGTQKDAEPGVYYGQVGGQIFELETALADSLAIAPGDWRSTAWTALQVFKIESARFTSPELELEVARDEADWLRGEERVAYSAVSDVLYPLTEAKGQRVLERAEALAAGYTLGVPSLSIVLAPKDAEAQHLKLFEAQGDLVAATREGRDVVLLLPLDQVNEIRTKLAELAKVDPLPESGLEASEESSPK